MTFQTRWYQQEANTATLNYLLANAGKGIPANPLIVLPTGSGKSLTINDLIRTIFYYYGTQKIIVATDVKELVEQNSNNMLEYWPQAPIGVCSAGLGRYETQWPIIYGGIKTLINRIDELGTVSILIVDEAHMVSDKSTATYVKFIQALRLRNPHLVVIGYTATDYRLGMGKLTEGGIFTQVVYDMTTPEAFTRLFVEGFLVPPVAKQTKTQLSTDDVSLNGSNGDYNLTELQAAVDTDELNYLCLKEACEMGYDRRSWLVFCSGVEHAQHCAEILRRFGVPTEAVYDGLNKKQRREILAAYKGGELRAVTNNNILTKGFDHPMLDFIINLRPTVSASLWVQMLGRGMRPFFDAINNIRKRNCLVADFARNVDKLGTIDNIRIPNKKGKGGGEAPFWLCESCNTKNHARAAFCIDCGAVHVFEQKLVETAATVEFLSNPSPDIQLFDVTGPVIYMPYQPKTKPDGTVPKRCLHVTYHCKNRRFIEMLRPDGKPYEIHKFHDWWKQRHLADPPASLYDIQFYTDQLRKPRQIRVWVNKGKYPEILGAIF
jgi:DNA repair protein RadD